MTNTRARTDLIWNLSSSLWTGALLLLSTRWYVSAVGLDGYGIIGFWLLLQGMVGLLDFGMGSALLRGLSKITDPKASSNDEHHLLRSIEIASWLLGAIFAVLVLLFALSLEKSWSAAVALRGGNVRDALLLIVLGLIFQLPFLVYSNGLMGVQRHRTLSIIQIIGNTLRHAGGGAVLLSTGNLFIFFGFQATVSAIQMLMARQYLWRHVKTKTQGPAKFQITTLGLIWKFSAGMAVTSISAVLLANIDRLALSKLDDPSRFGIYALAFTAASLLQFGIQPFYRVYFPRYSQLYQSGNTEALEKEYHLSCQMLAGVLIPAAAMAAIFAEPIFRVWTAVTDTDLILVFRLLLVGICLSGIAWLPAAFQQAHGWTRLHALMLVGTLLIGAPILLVCIQQFGIAGATVVWLLHGVSDMTIGIWLMHRRLLKGQMVRWYLVTVLRPVAITLCIALPMYMAARWLSTDLWQITCAAVAAVAAMALSLEFSNAMISRRFKSG